MNFSRLCWEHSRSQRERGYLGRDIAIIVLTCDFGYFYSIALVYTRGAMRLVDPENTQSPLEGAGNPSVGSATPPPGISSDDGVLEGAANQTATVLGGYQLVRVIAAGGMGTVHEAIQLNLSRKVAIKLLNADLAARPEFVQRFQREAKAAAALNHPNMVQVHDFGQAERHCFLVMEYVEGRDLEQLVNEHGPFEIEGALRIIEEAAIALKAACHKSIIHRDIKPSNLMLTSDGRVKVSDLGLAKIMTEASDLTVTGLGMGSPYYMAPEQANDASDVDHRADIYSLGVTLVFLLTGKRPFQGATPFSVVLAHANKPLPSGAELGRKLPEEVEVLIRKMTAKEPDDRHADYDVLLEDLRRVRGGQRPAVNIAAFKRKFATKAAVPVTVTLALVAIALLIVAIRLHARHAGQKETPVAGISSAAPQGPQPPGPPPPGTEMAGPEVMPPGPERFGEGALLPDEGDLEGAGPRQGAGFAESTIPLPFPPLARQNPSPLKDSSVDAMLAEADAFAKRFPQNYRAIIDRYRQVFGKTKGTPHQAEAGQKLKHVVEQHQVALRAMIRDYRKRMDDKIKEGKPQEAYDVWKDFPNNLRTLQSDQQIRQMLARALPPDFKPK